MRYSGAYIYLLLLATAMPAFSQDVRSLFSRHRYPEVIEQLETRRSNGVSLTEQEHAILGMALLRRAQVYRAAVWLQREAGAHLFRMRDRNQTAVKTPYHAYFYGRYLLENGYFEASRAQFDVAAGSSALPASFRRRAGIWKTAATLLEGQDASWPSAGSDAAARGDLWFARWKTGDSSPGQCSGNPDADVAVARCYLWRDAVHSSSDSDAAGRLAAAVPADAVHPVGNIAFSYYDPSTLDVLALADFNAALDILSNVPLQEGRDILDLSAGIAAFELKRYDAATVLLNRTKSPERMVYLGAIDQEQGHSFGVQTNWEAARRGDSSIRIEWAWIASRYPSWRRDVSQVVSTTGAMGEATQEMLQEAAGALMRTGQHEQALGLLEQNYPAEYNNDLDRIAPVFFLRLAHARFLSGRSQYNLVNGQLHTILQRYPALLGVAEIVKAATNPSLGAGEVVTDH